MSENDKKEAQAECWASSEDRESGTLTFSGEVDFTVTPKLRECIAKFIDETSGDIVLELGDLEYIDSSGLAAMIEARKILASKGRKISINSISPQVKRLFNLTQIGELFGL